MKDNKFYSYMIMIIGILAVSTAAIFVKLATEVPPAMIANYRLLFATITLLPFLLIFKRRELVQLTKKDWLLIALAGISLCIYFILWFQSLHYTSVASSAIFIALQPILAFLATSLLFKERFSQGATISIIISIAGCFIIAWGDLKQSSTLFYGDILALLATFFITVYFLLGQKVRKHVSLLTYTTTAYLFGTIGAVLFNIVLRNDFFSYSTKEWGVFVSIAIVPTVIGLNLLNLALKRMRTSLFSTGIIFEPVAASLLAFIILHENISWWQWLGGMILIFGLLLFIASTRRKRKMKVTITP
ncbi:DMT family transporter [Gracilibacillus marinus]|uniref:DMT family transporter n=1 Tax=Gracilibacillus marinus TaxID=630535 RepID=A0ABV8VYT0_9BACI